MSPVIQPPIPDIIPSEDEELWSDEPQLETNLHLKQIIILLDCLEWWWREQPDFFASGNISIYYEKQSETEKRHKFRGPDFFVVKNTEAKERKSWVVWQEGGRFPNIIIEILSKKTAKTDRTTKKDLYQDTFKTPEYFWFHPETLEFAGFRLTKGIYQPITRNPAGWMWSEELNLFLGIYERQLRYFTSTGELVPIPVKELERERQQREIAQQQAAYERQQREIAQQQADNERQQREIAQQQADNERQQREIAQQQADIAQQQADNERQQREIAQQQADNERQQREIAQQQADNERQQREIAQQRLAEMEEILARYREQLGEVTEE